MSQKFVSESGSVRGCGAVERCGVEEMVGTHHTTGHVTDEALRIPEVRPRRRKALACFLERATAEFPEDWRVGNGLP